MTLPGTLPLGPALAALLVMAVAAFAVGAWVGSEWRSGRDAQIERDDLRRHVDALDAASMELRRRGLAVAQDFRSAQIRFETTAEGLHDDLASLDAAFASQRADIESLLARHPEWVDCRIGPDGVLAWNAAAIGAHPATDATAILAEGADGAVPGRTADADGRQPSGTDPQLSGGRRAVPPLPLPDAAIDGGARRP